MHRISVFCLAAGAFVLAAGHASAILDRLFGGALAAGGMAEVEAGKLASRVTDNAMVRQFGELMIWGSLQGEQAAHGGCCRGQVAAS